MASIKVDIEQKSLAVTSQNEIIISDWSKSVHVVDTRGQLLSIIKPPNRAKGLNTFLLAGVACYEDIIFICNFHAKKIHRESVSGTCKSLGDMPISITGYLTHLAFTPDCDHLLVVSYGYGPVPVTVSIYSLA